MIKNSFCAAFFFLFILHNSYTQSLHIGPRIGLNLSSIQGLPNGRLRPGSAVGAFISYSRGNVGFSTDILLSSKGGRTTSKYTTNTSSEIWNSYSNLIYLEVPLLANLFLMNEEHSFRPRVVAGPALAFKLSATESIDYRKDVTNSSDTSFSSSRVVSDSYRQADLGCIVGIGFDYQVSERACFNFDARYTLGLVDIDKTVLIDDLYNRNIAFYLGISYQIGK